MTTIVRRLSRLYCATCKDETLHSDRCIHCGTPVPRLVGSQAQTDIAKAMENKRFNAKERKRKFRERQLKRMQAAQERADEEEDQEDEA